MAVHSARTFIRRSSVRLIFDTASRCVCHGSALPITVTATCTYARVLYIGTNCGLYRYDKYGSSKDGQISSNGKYGNDKNSNNKDSNDKNSNDKDGNDKYGNGRLVRVYDHRIVRLVSGKVLYIVSKCDKYALLRYDGGGIECVYTSMYDIFVQYCGQTVIASRYVMYGNDKYDITNDGITSFIVMNRRRKCGRYDNRNSNRCDISNNNNDNRDIIINDNNDNSNTNNTNGNNNSNISNSNDISITNTNTTINNNTNDIITNNDINTSNDNISSTDSDVLGMVTTDKGMAIIFNLHNGVVLQQYTIRSTCITAVQYDGNVFITGDDSRILWYRIDMMTGRLSLYKQLNIHYSHVNMIVHRNVLITAGYDSEMHAVYIANGRCKKVCDRGCTVKVFGCLVCVVNDNKMNMYRICHSNNSNECNNSNGNNEYNEDGDNNGNGNNEYNGNVNNSNSNNNSNGNIISNTINNNNQYITNVTNTTNNDNTINITSTVSTISGSAGRLSFLLTYTSRNDILAFDVNDREIAYTDGISTYVLAYTLTDRLVIDKVSVRNGVGIVCGRDIVNSGTVKFRYELADTKIFVDGRYITKIKNRHVTKVVRMDDRLFVVLYDCILLIRMNKCNSKDNSRDSKNVNKCNSRDNSKYNKDNSKCSRDSRDSKDVSVMERVVLGKYISDVVVVNGTMIVHMDRNTYDMCKESVKESVYGEK